MRAADSIFGVWVWVCGGRSSNRTLAGVIRGGGTCVCGNAQAGVLRDAVNGATGAVTDAVMGAAANLPGGTDLLLSLGQMAMTHVKNAGATTPWRVREIAALCASRLIVCPSTPARLKEALLRQLTGCTTFEPKTAVKNTMRAWEGPAAKQQNELLCPGRSPKEAAAQQQQAEKEACGSVPWFMFHPPQNATNTSRILEL